MMVYVELAFFTIHHWSKSNSSYVSTMHDLIVKLIFEVYLHQQSIYSISQQCSHATLWSVIFVLSLRPVNQLMVDLPQAAAHV